MAHRTSKIVTLVSTVMLAISVLLFLAGYVFSPWDHYLSFSDESHVAVWARGIDSQIVFFNDAGYGPYRGSIIGITDAGGNVHPPRQRRVAFDSRGIYYRYFQRSDSTLWTLMVSLWYPIGLFAIMPGVHLLRFTPARRSLNAA